jgi:hypothetical protein
LLLSIAATLKTTLVGLFEAVVTVYPSTSQRETQQESIIVAFSFHIMVPQKEMVSKYSLATI